ncbi:MAG: hypothetical protein M1835_006415 [Candelina submexicana]|nr:MAG: hypothetical protein M1835_006415 [Candelina submexicana]
MGGTNIVKFLKSPGLQRGVAMEDSNLAMNGTMDADSSGGSNKILIIGAGNLNDLARPLTKYQDAHDKSRMHRALSRARSKASISPNRANIPCVVYERDPSPTFRPRDWNMGLHWALPSLKSLIPPTLFARLQSTQVDPNTPTKPVETLRFLNGKTGETMGEAQIEGFYRLRRSKIRTLLTEGLDIRWSKAIIDMTYSSDGRYVTAHFADGTNDTGCLLVGADGPRSSVRSLLLGEEKAKTTNIDYAATMCFAKYTRAQARFLRLEPFHPLFQCAPHPDGYFAWFGLHDAPNEDKPEDWTFFAYISFPEPGGEVSERKNKAEHLKHQKELARGFEEPFRSAFEWMRDEEGGTGVWYGKMNHWDPGERGHGWDNRRGRVTLVGDAAHPMTFQRGQGLNHAVLDARNLVSGVEAGWKRSGDDGGDGGGGGGGGGGGCREAGFEGGVEGREKVVGKYEEEMVRRGGEEVRLGERNTRMLHDWEQVLLSPVMRKGLGKDGR